MWPESDFKKSDTHDAVSECIDHCHLSLCGISLYLDGVYNSIPIIKMLIYIFISFISNHIQSCTLGSSSLQFLASCPQGLRSKEGGRPFIAIPFSCSTSSQRSQHLVCSTNYNHYRWHHLNSDWTPLEELANHSSLSGTGVLLYVWLPWNYQTIAYSYLSNLDANTYEQCVV